MLPVYVGSVKDQPEIERIANNVARLILCRQLKVPMKKKIVAAYLKGFSK